MHRIIAVLISSTILLNSFQITLTGLSQADDLIEHIQYHSEKYGDNLFTFLSKHYGNLKDNHDKNHKEEKQKHKQLPFHQSIPLQFSAFLLPEHEKTDLKQSKVVFRSSYFYYRESTSLFIPEKILQPPIYS